MTEEEAKKRWCPFARAPVPDMGTDTGLAVGNRYESNDDGKWNHCLCIGSQCMAWRKTKAPAELNTAMVEWRDGYCGLGGKP